jgi:dolichyl-phosphate-mannose--protein O-mannosyl transferase
MPVHLALVLAAVTSTTSTTVEEDVPRIVGDPLSWWVFIGAGVALFVFIVVGGLLVRRRASRAADPR